MEFSLLNGKQMKQSKFSEAQIVAILGRCSRVLGLRRTSLYYKYKRKDEDVEIAQMLKEKALEQPNWGFRVLFYWIRNQGKNGTKKGSIECIKPKN